MDFELCRDAVRRALRYWKRESRAGNPLADLRLFAHYRQRAVSDRNASNQLLLDVMAMLAEMHPREAELLRDRYVHGLTVAEVAKARGVAVSTLYNWQHAAIAHLAEIVQGREAQLQQRTPAPPATSLPVLVDDYLVGMTARAAPLLALLQSSEGPRMVALTGLGGIGKSTLALHLAQRLLAAGRYSGVAWLDLGQSGTNDAERSVRRLAAPLIDDLEARLPLPKLLIRLRQQLQSSPHILLVDHLEASTAHGMLLRWLTQLADPSLLLLTARHLPSESHCLQRVRVAALSRPDALALIRREAMRLGFHSVAQATDAELLPLYEAVGGHPLALRVGVNEIGNFGLPRTLTNLAAGRGRAISRMYDAVFGDWWPTLDSATRCLLDALLNMGTQPASLEVLAEAAALSNRAAQDALARLIEYNVIDYSGDFTQRTYTLNRLTRSYLQAVSATMEPMAV